MTDFYNNLDDWIETTKQNLKDNKGTMEEIMHHSSAALSKKIKSFEKKYTESYLKDKSKLDDCAETLEELFKRSKAIHEIRSKVTLYKEFLKMLHEEDDKKPAKDEDKAVRKETKTNRELTCTKDYEKIQEMHNTTLRLWKILLYWKKRKTMCYTEPF